MIAWDGKHCRAGVYSRRSLRCCMVGGTKAPPYDKQAKSGERCCALRLGVELFARKEYIKVFHKLFCRIITFDGGDVGNICKAAGMTNDGKPIKVFAEEHA